VHDAFPLALAGLEPGGEPLPNFQSVEALILAETIDRTPAGRELDELCRLVWSGLDQGRIPEAEAQALAEAVQARRALARVSGPERPGSPPTPPAGQRKSIFPPRRRQRSPNLAVSRERRQVVAGTHALPPGPCRVLTQGERAVLVIVCRAVAVTGRCDLSNGEISARAGVTCRHAQRAIRLAADMGLISVQERPQKGAKHQTNVIRVRCPQLAAWIKRWGQGDKRVAPRETKVQREGRKPAGTTRNRSSVPVFGSLAGAEQLE
jgi:hypothetical protein